MLQAVSIRAVTLGCVSVLRMRKAVSRFVVLGVAFSNGTQLVPKYDLTTNAVSIRALSLVYVSVFCMCKVVSTLIVVRKP